MHKYTKTGLLLLSFTALLSLTACGNGQNANATPTMAPKETLTPTAAATVTPAETAAPTMAPKQTLTPAPTATTAPTATPAPLCQDPSTIAELLPILERDGIVAAYPDKVTKIPSVSGANVEIESIYTMHDYFLIVTLNGRMTNMQATDISFKEHTINWYTYRNSSSSLTTKDSFVTVNDEGKTVIVYQINGQISGTKFVADYSKTKLSNLDDAIQAADNYISWQMDHGGWDKSMEIQQSRPWDGKEKKSFNWFSDSGEPLGTIDNDATTTQMYHIASVYREVPDAKYQESFLKGLDFIFLLQYESGGFAQVYPRRGGSGSYSNNVTFNDNAMMHVLYMLEDIRDGVYPFDSDLVPEEYLAKIDTALAKATDFIIKSQIVSQGKLTAWCAQHDPVTYAPVGARAYELASISGSESAGVVSFLLSQKQTPEITNAIECAIRWFYDSRLAGIEYVKKGRNGEYFVETPGHNTWYRFYEIDTNLPIFCDRDGIMKHDILEIGTERRHGYSWAVDTPKKILALYEKLGNQQSRIEASVTGTSSTTADGKTLEQNAVIKVTGALQE